MLGIKNTRKNGRLIKMAGKIVACGFVCLSMLACEPRGESRSLDEVFVTAKTKYASQVVGELPAGAETPLKRVSELLERLESAVSSPASSEYLVRDFASMGDNLDALIKMAGYTSRPALGALSASWSGLAHQVRDDNENYKANAVKLLLARTMFALASELEAVRFGIQ